MKVLTLFSNISYPPREGLHANSVNFLKNLSESGFDCAMAAFQRCGHPFDFAAFSADLPRVRVLSIIPTSHRYHLLTLRNLARAALPLPGDRFGRALDKILAKEDFDLVHIEGLPLAPYIGRFRNSPVAATPLTSPPSRPTCPGSGCCRSFRPRTATIS